MSTTPTAPKDTHRKTTAHPLYDTAATLNALNCSRWKLWDLCRNDPDFPKPRMIAGKRSWFVDELERYKESRPCRQYAETAA